MLKRNFLTGSILALSTAFSAVVMPVAASALDNLDVVYMRIPPLVHMIHAIEAGVFERHGLSINLMLVNGGPELMSALAAGSADLGLTSVPAVMLARAGGLELRAFGTADPETATDLRNWVVTNAATGIASLADLEGRTVGIAELHSAAEMVIRDHMLAAGADPERVNFVAIPFPQLPTALEVGNVDAIHISEPFFSQIMASTNIQPTVLAEGLIATLDEDSKIALGGWFARDEWLDDPANQEMARRFLRAILEANRELDADRALVDAILIRDFGMPAEVAARVHIPWTTDTLVADPADYAPTIRALTRTGLIDSGLEPEDVVVSITYE